MSLARLSLFPLGLVLLWIAAGTIEYPLPYPAVLQHANPVPRDVYPWQPAPIDKGLFKIRHKLKAHRLFEGQIHGSESVTVCPDGHLVMIDKYGAVRSAPKHPDSSTRLDAQPVAHLGAGRALGFAFNAAGNLVVCDALKGLVMVNMTSKQVLLLTNRVSADSPLQPDTPIVYANDLDIGKDGTIYFTDSVNITTPRVAQHVNNVDHIITIRGEQGYYDTAKGWGLGMLQGLPQGRLLAYYPHNHTTHVLADGFYYSNGVALSEDESFVVIGETDRLRVLKRYLPPHPRAGQMEVLIDGLPGTPDGVTRAPDGAFWVSLIANVPKFTKYFSSPLVRFLLARIPENLRPQIPTWGAVVKVSPTGQVLQWLVDPLGEVVSKISSAHEHGDRLYLGNLAGDYVSYVDLSDLPPDGAIAEE